MVGTDSSEICPFFNNTVICLLFLQLGKDIYAPVDFNTHMHQTLQKQILIKS